MTIITWPSAIVPNSIKWRKPPVEQVQRGMGGRTRIAVIGPAQRWSIEAELPPLADAAAETWRGFVAALKGRQNTFRLVTSSQEQHASSPTVLANAATNAGLLAIVLKGMPVSTTLLNAGRMITVTLASGDEQLFVLTSSLTSNVSGIGTANLDSPLRENVLVNAPVQTKSPWALMRADDAMGWSVAPALIYGHTFVAEEAF